MALESTGTVYDNSILVNTTESLVSQSALLRQESLDSTSSNVLNSALLGTIRTGVLSIARARLAL